VSLVGNEQAKLTATYLNGVAIALAAIGGVAPWVGVVVQSSSTDALRVSLSSLVCFSLSVALHYTARRVLTKLR